MPGMASVTYSSPTASAELTYSGAAGWPTLILLESRRRRHRPDGISVRASADGRRTEPCGNLIAEQRPKCCDRPRAFPWLSALSSRHDRARVVHRHGTPPRFLVGPCRRRLTADPLG